MEQSEAERKEETKAQLGDEEEADDVMLDVAARMEQVMRDTMCTHNWLALQHIFHSLKSICRRGFSAESQTAGREQLSDELLMLARLCAAAIKQKMRAVVSDSRSSSPANDTPPLPRSHSAHAVHSDPSTPQRVPGLRGHITSPDSAPISAPPSAHPASVPSSRSSRFNPSSRAQLSASTNTTPAASRAASPALVLHSAPSLTHSLSSPANSTSDPQTSPAPAAADSPLSQRPLADYQQLSYELGRKALLHTYMRRSTSKGNSAKKGSSGRIGGSSTPPSPRVSQSPPPPSPPPTHERKESDSERVKAAVDSVRSGSMKDFHFIRCLSFGGSSRVWLCEKRSTGDKYAVKVMRKHELLHRNNAHRAMLERHILSLSSHPYIVPLYYAIPSRHHLYLVLEYMRGGDLADLLHSSPSSMSSGFIRSVLAEVLLSLEYLHELGYVHRDVKPENIMLDGTGHVKLTDFGLSKHWLHTTDHTAAVTQHADVSSPPASEHRRDSSATDSDSSNSSQNRSLLPSASRFSAVGTHNYLAPETILGLPATPAVDWWALGVLAFHLLIGQPPFAAESVDAVMDNIVRGRVRWDDRREERLGKEGADLVRRLLVVDTKQRLGSGGAEEIKRHPYFAGVEWNMLMQQKGDSIANSATAQGTWQTETAADEPASTSSTAVAQASDTAAYNSMEQPNVEVTPAHSTGFSHVPSSRARHSTSTSPSVSTQVSPSTLSIAAPAPPQLPASRDDEVASQPQPAPSPPRCRPHLLTSLPAFTASSEFDRYAALSDTPSPSSPAKLASASLPSYLTSLAPVTTDLSLSALSSFPSLSEASSSLLSSLSLRTSNLLPSDQTAASPPVLSANQSSLDRLLSLTKPSAATYAAKPSFDTSIVSRPLSSHTPTEQPPVDAAEQQEAHDGQYLEQLPMRRNKSRDCSHAVKARRKISASAKIASRTLRSAYSTNPARPMRLSPPASFRASHRSPPAAASTRRSRGSFDGSGSLSLLAAVGVSEWSSDADNGDADSDLDRVSEMRREALQARKRKDLSRTSPTVQQREQRHYARKSPAAAARRVGNSQQADSSPATSTLTVGPLSSDDSDQHPTAAAAVSVSAGVGGVRAVLADVVLSEYISAPADVQSSPSRPAVPDWLLPASDESSEWNEFCSDFSERSIDRLAGSASEGGGSGSSSGSREVERYAADARGAASGESGVWSSEFASDWSVGSEDEVFDGFAWKNLATLQAKNEQVYQQQMAAVSSSTRS